MLREPGQAHDHPVVPTVVPSMNPVPALAPVVAQRVELVPEDGEARPPVRQHELHAPLLPRPTAAHVEEEDRDQALAGDHGHVRVRGQRVECHQPWAHPALRPQAREGGLDQCYLSW